MTDDLPSVGTDDARSLAELLKCGMGCGPTERKAATMLRALVSERDELASRVAELEIEVLDQCRLNGMGAERESALMGRVRELEGERDAALADSERRHTLLKMQHAESVELYNALSDLSFECDGLTCVLPPSRETYNRTFMVLKMKPHLSPSALRGHGEAGGTANATTEPKRDLMFATVAMQQREEERINRIVSGLEQVKQEHIASKEQP